MNLQVTKKFFYENGNLSKLVYGNNAAWDNFIQSLVFTNELTSTIAALNETISQLSDTIDSQAELISDLTDRVTALEGV